MIGRVVNASRTSGIRAVTSAMQAKTCSSRFGFQAVRAMSTSQSRLSALINKPAPDFTADVCMGDNSYGQVKLSDFKDKKYVVLFFYPANFTFVCASELPGFQKLYKEFQSRNVEVLGCSTDTKFAHRAWKLHPAEDGGIGEISYPIIGDHTKKISRDYGVLMEDIGLCSRGVFLIDKAGVVQAAHFNNLALGRCLEEVLRLVDALQFHEKSVADGNPQVCPASWKKGKAGMDASHAGVNKFGKEGGLGKYVEN